MNRESGVGIVTGYGLDEKGVGVRVLERLEFLLLHVVQTGSGADLFSRYRGLFQGGAAAGA
jgi:hypothetical protein